jgi:hypothetical protein
MEEGGRFIMVVTDELMPVSNSDAVWAESIACFLRKKRLPGEIPVCDG